MLSVNSRSYWKQSSVCKIRGKYKVSLHQAWDIFKKEIAQKNNSEINLFYDTKTADTRNWFNSFRKYYEKIRCKYFKKQG